MQLFRFKLSDSIGEVAEKLNFNFAQLARDDAITFIDQSVEQYNIEQATLARAVTPASEPPAPVPELPDAAAD